MSRGEPVISAARVSRRFGSVLAVDAVSFEAAPGEMLGLIGPDGAGKTTTLRMVLGLLAPDSGEMRTCGLDPIRGASALSRRVGYLPQRFSLYGDLTVDENVAFFAELHGVREFRGRRDELLETLRLAPFRRRLADRLSGGMKQKLSLACNLIHTPELLVLDEPTTGVDPVSRRDFWKILSGLQQAGMTFLITTPYLDEAERCGRIGLMSRGRLLTLDTPARIRGTARGTVLEVLATPRRRAAEILAARTGVSDVLVFGERLHATIQEGAAGDPSSAASGVAAALAAEGIEVQSVRPVAASLEDVFIARIRDEEASR